MSLTNLSLFLQPFVNASDEHHEAAAKICSSSSSASLVSAAPLSPSSQQPDDDSFFPSPLIDCNNSKVPQQQHTVAMAAVTFDHQHNFSMQENHPHDSVRNNKRNHMTMARDVGKCSYVPEPIPLLPTPTPEDALHPSSSSSRSSLEESFEQQQQEQNKTNVQSTVPSLTCNKTVVDRQNWAPLLDRSRNNVPKYNNHKNNKNVHYNDNNNSSNSVNDQNPQESLDSSWILPSMEEDVDLRNFGFFGSGNYSNSLEAAAASILDDFVDDWLPRVPPCERATPMNTSANTTTNNNNNHASSTSTSPDHTLGNMLEWILQEDAAAAARDDRQQQQDHGNVCV